MKKILLCCAGGFSTSFVVSQMKNAAKKKGIDCKIWAVGEKDIDDALPQADIVMVAPQLAYRAGDFEKRCEKQNKKCARISQMDYGRVNGDAILSQALRVLGGA